MQSKYLSESEILHKLSNYMGSENFYKDPFNKCVYTDGFKEFIELTGSHWLYSDYAILIMMNKKLRSESFITLKINVDQDKHTAIVKLTDGNYKVLYEKKYTYTDFPLKEYEFFICKNEFNSFTFLLMGEY